MLAASWCVPIERTIVTRSKLRFAWMRCVNVVLAVYAASMGAMSLAGTPAISLQIGETELQGALSDDAQVVAFTGLPFAKAPIGDRRWAPPAPAELPRGKYDATHFGPACAQGPHILNWYRALINDFGGNSESFPTPRFSEDCLYLNVWRPAAASPAERLPVLVYLHGGSNKGGWAYEPNYIGEALARRGVIVVSIAYRLGIFGFFAHPQLEHANFALLDQLAALRWLQINAAALGADHERVTLMGESAGANNIAYLIASPLAEGLFQRVIHQSAGWAFAAGPGDPDTEIRTHLALQEALVGIGGTLEELRKVPAQSLIESMEQLFPNQDYEPVIDGHSLMQSLAEALSTESAAKIDLLIGSNADEWLMYLGDDDSLANWMTEQSDPKAAQAALAAVPKDIGEARQLDKLITAEQFVCPSLGLAGKIQALGGQSWFYYFARQREGELASKLGAYHGAELPYVFATHDDWLPTSAVDRALSDTMMQYWLNFAATGNPNSLDLPPWPQFEADGNLVQWLDDSIHSAVHPSLQLCDALAGGADKQ